MRKLQYFLFLRIIGRFPDNCDRRQPITIIRYETCRYLPDNARLCRDYARIMPGLCRIIPPSFPGTFGILASINLRIKRDRCRQ
jgi:hypothetical protein